MAVDPVVLAAAEEAEADREARDPIDRRAINATAVRAATARLNSTESRQFQRFADALA